MGKDNRSKTGRFHKEQEKKCFKKDEENVAKSRLKKTREKDSRNKDGIMPRKRKCDKNVIGKNEGTYYSGEKKK